jgi:hypothetical protein
VQPASLCCCSAFEEWRPQTGTAHSSRRVRSRSSRRMITWLRRSQKHDLEGLRDRLRRPLVSPDATKSDVVRKTVLLDGTTTSGRTDSRSISALPRRQISASWDRVDPEAAGHEPTARLPALARSRSMRRHETPPTGTPGQIGGQFIAPVQGAEEGLPAHLDRRCIPIRVLGVAKGQPSPEEHRSDAILKITSRRSQPTTR